VSKNITNKHFLLVMLVFVNLIVGFLILPGFGESEDEFRQDLYVDRISQSLQSLTRPGFNPAEFMQEEPKLGSHGPAFILVVAFLRNLFLQGGGAVERLYFAHFLYFIAFQVGVVSIYFLARRWVSETAAFGTALLFNTQPLLFGHAFMNATDVVFMSLLTASAALGLRMVERDARFFQATGQPFQDGMRAFFREFRNGDVWLAGLALGFSSAIRIAAPLIGVLILVYILLTHKWQVLPRFLVYGLLSFVFMFIFWPYLWPDPIGRLLGSIASSVNYPDVHLTLFKGVLFDTQEIPLSYLPVLLTVQLTIPTLILVALGGFSLLKKIRWDFVALVLIWFVLPVTAAMLGRIHLYNNFRHVFFILPPLFLTAGWGLDWLLKFFKRPVIQYLIIFLSFLPGLYANIKLYPYQYVYYNQLAGGVSGAYHYYELDYWDLAFREAQLYLNQTAGQNANIYVDKSKYVAQTFARPDFVYNAFGGKDLQKYDYIVVSTAENADQRFAKFPTVFVVEEDGVPLAYVKKPRTVERE
jgi:hypothetical protein